MKQAFYPLYKQNIALAWQQESIFLDAFCLVPGCQTCVCKRPNISLFSQNSFNQVFYSFIKNANKFKNNSNIKISISIC